MVEDAYKTFHEAADAYLETPKDADALKEVFDGLHGIVKELHRDTKPSDYSIVRLFTPIKTRDCMKSHKRADDILRFMDGRDSRELSYLDTCVPEADGIDNYRAKIYVVGMHLEAGYDELPFGLYFTITKYFLKPVFDACKDVIKTARKASDELRAELTDEKTREWAESVIGEVAYSR